MDKNHSQDNQDKEVVQMQYREQKKKNPLRTTGVFSSILPLMGLRFGSV